MTDDQIPIPISQSCLDIIKQNKDHNCPPPFGDVTTGPGIQEQCIVVDQENGIYRKLFFKDDILQGAILIGTKENLHTLKTLTIHRASLKEVKEHIQIYSILTISGH